MKKKVFNNYLKSRPKVPFSYGYRPRYRKRIFDFRNLNHKYFKILQLVSTVGFDKRRYPLHLASFRNRFTNHFVYLSRRVGNYDVALKKPKKDNKLVSKFQHFLFPYTGMHSRAFLFRNKYFFKRRSISNFFKFGFHSVNSSVYRATSSFFSTLKFRLHIRQTKNNLFFFLRTSAGRLVFIYTNGQTIYKGSKRSTTSAADLAGKQVSRFLAINKLISVCLVFDTPLTSIVKAAVRGLSTKLEFSGMLAYRFISHNGIKAKSTRRV